MKELGALDEVANDAGLVGDGNTIGLVTSDRGGMRVRYRAHAADALYDLGGILGGAVLHHKLHAAEAATGNPGIRDDTVRVHFHLDAQVTFDTGNRVDN